MNNTAPYPCMTYRLDNSEFKVNFHPVSRPVQTLKQELINTANYIRNSTGKDLVVSSSGGIDSEIVCRAFLDAQIPFRMFIVEFDNGRNEHDVAYAHKFAEIHGIEKIIYKIDMDDFFNHDIYKYVKQGYRSQAPYRYFQIHILEQIENLGCCGIMAAGETLFVAKEQDIYMTYDKDYFLLHDWCQSNGVLHYPCFHSTTPELIAAFLDHPVNRFLTSNSLYVQQIANKTTNDLDNPEKIIVYHSVYPHMQRRRKYHGWETMLDSYLETRWKLGQLSPYIPKINIPLKQIRDQLGI